MEPKRRPKGPKRAQEKPQRDPKERQGAPKGRPLSIEGARRPQDGVFLKVLKADVNET